MTTLRKSALAKKAAQARKTAAKKALLAKKPAATKERLFAKKATAPGRRSAAKKAALRLKGFLVVKVQRGAPEPASHDSGDLDCFDGIGKIKPTKSEKTE